MVRNIRTIGLFGKLDGLLWWKGILFCISFLSGRLFLFTMGFCEIFIKIIRGVKNISRKKVVFSMMFCIITAVIISGYTGALDTENDIERLKEYEKGSIKKVCLLKDDDEKNSALIQEVENQGYKSNIKMHITIGFADSRIKDFDILFHNESENYAKYIEEEWFLKRFLGKKTDSELKLVKMAAKSSNEIVAVTGATISSKAIIEGVNKAFKNYNLIKGGLINEEKK